MNKKLLINIVTVMIFMILLSSLSSFARDREKQFEPLLTFDGIGIVAESAAAGYRVTGVFRNSPAYHRIKKGDIITKINGISTRRKISDWFYHNIRKPAGTTLDLEISRMGEWVNLRLRTAKIEIKRNTIPESSFPMQKIAEIEGKEIIITSTSSGGLPKIGDSFFVFNGDKHIGYVRVRKISDGKAILQGENLKETITSGNFKKLDLRYFTCVTSRQRISSSKGKTGKKSGYDKAGNKSVSKDYRDGKPVVTVESYSLYLDGDRVFSKVILRNTGNAPARGFILTCFFVDRHENNMGQRSREIRLINPGEKKLCVFAFANKVDPLSNFVEFRDNDTRVVIHQGLSTANPVLLELECRFLFE